MAMLATEVEPLSTVAKTVAMLASKCQTPPQIPPLSLPPTDSCSLITSGLSCSRSRAAVHGGKDSGDVGHRSRTAVHGFKDSDDVGQYVSTTPQPPPLSLPPTDSCLLITSGLCCSRSRAAVHGGKDSGDVGQYVLDTTTTSATVSATD
ncbi:hypothetical protein J6590_034428 [Homalodisca vitripennis]|nr:hypothetical protein J6590_034428 [Homalodisca vitripennis]